MFDLKTIDGQYKIKNDGLPKTYNSLNFIQLFCLLCNKSINIILFLFFYFQLSHIFFFFICTSFFKLLSPNVVFAVVINEIQVSDKFLFSCDNVINLLAQCYCFLTFYLLCILFAFAC